MIRRCLIAVALTLGLLPGCGMAVRKLDAESLAAAATLGSPFPQPPHRVALAAFEVMRNELAAAEFAKASEFSPAPKLVKPDGTKPKAGELPANYPGFWLEWKNNDQPIRALVTLKAAHFAGKVEDGRPVEVGVVSQAGETALTIRFDKLGDRMYSIYLRDKVADRLAHPTYPPGSIEEAAAFQAFFGGIESRESLPSIHKKALPAKSS